MKRSRFIAALLALGLAALPAAAAEPPRIVIDHRVLFPQPDSLPFIENGRTLVPLRAIFEYLGAAIEWDGATQTVTARKGDTLLVLQVGSPTATINGKSVTLDQPAVLVQNRAFVPLRLVGEAFAATVNWYEAASPVDWISPLPTVAITSQPFAAPGPLTFTPAPGALQQRTAAPGEPLTITDEGIGFLDLATGRADSYAIPGAEARTIGYGASTGGRFVIARGIERGYILDRQTRETKAWDHRQYELVTAGKERLLFQAVTPNPAGWVTSIDPQDGQLEGYLAGSRGFVLVDSGLKPILEFTLPEASGRPVASDEALLNDAETKAMISWGNNTYLVDLTSGLATTITSAAQLQPAKGGAEVVAIQTTRHGTTVTRYDWAGKVLAENLVPASHVKLSGDGEWVAWEVFLEGFTPAVYFARLGETEKAQQALGASMCYGSVGTAGSRWVPGPNGWSLLVGTREGLRTIQTDGTIAPLTAPAGWTFYDPVPAPGSEPLYRYSRSTKQGTEMGAVTPAGEVVATFTTLSSGGGIAPSLQSPSWGATADELRVSLVLRLGGGGPCGDYSIPLPLKVYAPGTYDGALALQVVAPGDCVAIREQPWIDSPMVRCLPDGERIVIGNHTSDALPTFHHNADGQWFQLPEGWIRTSSGLLQFAP